MTNQNLLLPAIILSLGLAALGGGVAFGLMAFKASDKTVSVKGLAVRDVEADLAIWTIRHTATGDDLAAVQSEIAANTAKVKTFLTAQGLAAGDIGAEKLEVTDLLANAYRSGEIAGPRYIITSVITARTNDVNALDKAFGNAGQLLTQNVAIANEQGRAPVEYIFTGLNALKPAMIAEATKSARESADQFAKDSGTSVGAIKYASQGVFQILPRDSEDGYMQTQSRYKSVRVVSTVNFELE
ncbi:MAG TPA: SIMPL domain-containing protein [Alphaproteobacteria bacterium]|nr:SIMPL domain-containing protein [Alphaproteobacteria bacterium]